MREECKEIVPSVDANLVTSCLNLLEAFLTSENLDLKKVVSPDKVVMVYLIFSLIWSLGANLYDASRKNFHRFLKFKIATLYSDFPEQGEIYDYGIDLTTHRFIPFMDQVPTFEYNPKKSYFEILVPTTDTVKYRFLLNVLLNAGLNVLISGETGVGKSVITQEFLNTADEELVSASIGFSGKTTSRNLQDVFESKLEKKRKTLLGPPGGKKMVFFIDDVNMPQLEKYGA